MATIKDFTLENGLIVEQDATVDYPQPIFPEEDIPEAEEL